MMVICSNKWAEELQTSNLSEADKDYIKKNLIYVHVTEDLWVEPNGSA